MTGSAGARADPKALQDFLNLERDGGDLRIIGRGQNVVISQGDELADAQAAVEGVAQADFHAVAGFNLPTIAREHGQASCNKARVVTETHRF